MLFRRASPSGSASSSRSSSSSSSPPPLLARVPMLSLTAIDIPDTAAAFPAYLTDARSLVDDFLGAAGGSSSGWKDESSHGVDARVATCRGARLGAGTKELVDEHETWIGRVSEHDDLDWADVQPLLLDEEGRGGEWVPDLKSNDVVSVYEPSTLPPGIHSAAVVHVSVAMPFPLAGRAFLSVVFTATPAEGEFWNVSVPVQDSSCPAGKGDESGLVRARQVVVERVRKLPSGKIEWVSVKAFSLGGNIPQRQVDKKMSGRSADEITTFLRWVKARK